MLNQCCNMYLSPQSFFVIQFFAAIHFAANCIAFIEANYFLLNDFALIYLDANCIAFIEVNYFLLNDFALIYLDANCIVYIEVNYFLLNDIRVNFSPQNLATICIATSIYTKVYVSFIDLD
ncbi:hypothetical protein SAMN05444355_11739 [Flavobacterium frigoris]|uniref:Uncharacterized protein n=1 Tax=Flavobacterium frigoris TaxID=229204 RepID=A0A1H9QP26_FLAFI|nr:hypothetical protein SAMN05444355_11739 [Flavobacterium frigoris]